jgi:hypothetical protein
MEMARHVANNRDRLRKARWRQGQKGVGGDGGRSNYVEEDEGASFTDSSGQAGYQIVREQGSARPNSNKTAASPASPSLPVYMLRATAVTRV